ncbi:MAG: acyl-CoA dehydrogenase family protein [Alphaproteobacteria bacterium]
MSAAPQFQPCSLPAGADALRAEVRAFLRRALADVPPERRALSWSGFDAGFSRALGAQGWIGMTWPAAYGGHGRSALDRYVVSEELLASGAPIGAHWIADRQSGPLLLKFGTDAQRKQFLPPIARGESYFCIGMSEPNSGSDLAGLRTKAVRDADGWRIDGSKIWTTNAQHCHFMIALVRTSKDDKDRHAGLSQFIVDLKSPGVTVRPIRDMSGAEHFNEVFFDNVYVPDDMLVGRAGGGWAQVLSELAFERSGPERYLSTNMLLVELLRALPAERRAQNGAIIGRIVARMATLRQMSLSVAGMLDRGEDPGTQAAMVKDLGTGFEQELVELAQGLLDLPPTPAADALGTSYQRVLGQLMQAAPSFSLRGGTREILRGIIARGLGLR